LTHSPDGRQYIVTLRDGLRFSDAVPLTADVVFSFGV
jgi:ABC-type transport system substrate-binding protein